jgi:hypothetical protein
MIKLRKIKLEAYVACIGEVRNAYETLVRRLQRKRQLARPMHRWEVNIKLDFKEIEYEGVV